MRKLAVLCCFIALVAVLGACTFTATKDIPLHFVVDGVAFADTTVYSYRKNGLDVGTKSGYRFDGWYADKAYTQSARPGSATEETTLYGRWVVIETVLPKYTISFCYEDGTVYQTLLTDTIDTARFPQPPPKDGYLFAGWRGVPDKLTSDVSVVPTYRKLYTVTFYSAQDQVLQESTVGEGGYVSPPAAPVKASDKANTYEFTGWRCDGNGDLNNVRQNIKAYPTYAEVAIKYNYVFHPQNGEEDIVGSGVYEQYISFPSVKKASQGAIAYTFAGWDIDGDGQEDGLGRGIRLQSDLEAWAVYSASDLYLRVRFYADGRLKASYSVKYGEGIAYDGETPQKEADDPHHHYEFDGWDADFDVVCENLDVNAVFVSQPNLYSYTFMDGDTVLKSEQNVPYGTLIEPPADPQDKLTKEEESTFVGWDGYSADMEITQDCIFSALYQTQKRKYSVMFYDSLKNIRTTYEIEYGAAIPAAPFPDYDEVLYVYEWTGWYEGAVVDRDRNYTYTLSRTRAYWVSWMSDDETLYQKDKVAKNTVPVLPTPPQKEGFGFVQWQGDTAQAITADTVFVAQWQVQSTPPPEGDGQTPDPDGNE